MTKTAAEPEQEQVAKQSFYLPEFDIRVEAATYADALKIAKEKIKEDK